MFILELVGLTHKFVEEEIWIGGDFNAHIGIGNAGFEGVHGGVGFGERNEEGISLLDWVSSFGGCVLNTFFKRQDRHLVTCQSGDTSSMVDMWLVKQVTPKEVKNTNVIYG